MSNVVMCPKPVVSGPPTFSFVTGATGTIRTDAYWAGYQVQVGLKDIILTALGRWVSGPSSGVHLINLNDANNNLMVQTSVNLAGASVGSSVFSALATPILLTANRQFVLLSQESGDPWLQNDGSITALPDATLMNGNYMPYTGPGSGAIPGTGAIAWVPPNFQYTVAPTNIFIFAFPSGPTRNDSFWVGFQGQVGSAPITITALGRGITPGNTATHRLNLLDSSGNLIVQVSVATAGQTQYTFAYTNLTTPIVMAAGQTFYLLSEELGGSESWTDAQTYPTASAAGVVSGAYLNPGTGIGLPNSYSSNEVYVPTNFLYHF